jgi:hypothetical protein
LGDAPKLSANNASTPAQVAVEFYEIPDGEIAYADIWSCLVERLEAWDNSWKSRVDETAVTDQQEKRAAGAIFSDAEVMEAVCLSLFSAQVDWKRIQDIREELRIKFHNYEVSRLSAWTDVEIKELQEWFLMNRAGSQSLKKNLLYTRVAAKMFMQWMATGVPLDGYITKKFEELGRDPVTLAVAIATAGDMKIAGMGVPLAAEFLRNLGYDLSKPDIHILRAAGCFNMVRFNRWRDYSVRRSPSASIKERVQVMHAMDQFAKSVGMTTTYLDSVIWTACAKSGAWLTNEELQRLAKN